MAPDAEDAARLRALRRLQPGLAHDLRSPLNGLVLNLELLKQSLGDAAGDGPDSARRFERALTLERELARLRRAIDRLLAELAPAEAGRERFDLHQLVREVAELVEPQGRQQGVEVELDADSAPLPVEASRDRLKGALLQLAVHALDRASAGGRIGLSARRHNGAAHAAIGGGPAEPAAAGAGDAEPALAAARAAVGREGGELARSAGDASFVVRLPLQADPP